ncbi:MAG: hypothetical protein HQL49_12920 [Gammaproteobacteria bacterium]|nr:hypothetical protein [Gammaproteobacteria bacterium]
MILNYHLLFGKGFCQLTPQISRPKTRQAGENRSLTGVVSIAEPSPTPLTFDKTIEASLLPLLLHTLKKSPEQEHERLISNFNVHVRLLSEYLRGEKIDGKLSIDTAIGFHVRLYPPGHMILGTNQEGKAVYVSPGAFHWSLYSGPHISDNSLSCSQR